MPSISYGICVCNEIEEIKRLIKQIEPYIRQEDEIVVLFDSEGGTQDVKKYLDEINVEFEFKKISFHRVFYKLNKDFATFKNFLKQHCSKDYLFQIDADETVSPNILQHLPIILENNPVDIFLIPRVNTVEGLTQEHINKWRWTVNENMRVNWPDYQMRIIHNISEIKWENKVHERITGYKTLSHFPMDNEDWCLFHPKTIQRQEKQNNFYDTI